MSECRITTAVIDLAEIFEAELKGLATNFPESWALKFFHCPRKTQSSEFSCLLCGMRSVHTIRTVGKNEQCWDGCREELKQSPNRTLVQPHSGWERPHLSQILPAHVSSAQGKPCSQQAWDCTPGTFAAFIFSPCVDCLLTSCSLWHLCHPPLLSSRPFSPS